jgi:hypothetical protein
LCPFGKKIVVENIGAAKPIINLFQVTKGVKRDDERKFKNRRTYLYYVHILHHFKRLAIL